MPLPAHQRLLIAPGIPTGTGTGEPDASPSRLFWRLTASATITPTPEGTVLAKDGFLVRPDGKMDAGLLFFIEKMALGFNAESGDWRYMLILPNTRIRGTAGGKYSAKTGFCIECHAIKEEAVSCFFLDGEYRE